MVDIHCHILPEVDDGPKSWEAAEAMCRMAAEDGIQHIVATPHANDRYFYCDFHLSYENMQSASETPERYCIASSRYLLVEFSNFSIPPQIDEWFTYLHGKGITAILTHPERNPLVQQETQRVLQWIALGCAVQVTASAFTGAWGERTRQTAEWLLKEKAVHFLATDAHDTQRRPPVLSAARKFVEKQYGEELARALVIENPSAVINNQPLPYFSKA